MKDAKGHGSNKRGLHASGIERVGNVRLHPKVIDTVIKNPGGFSVKPNNGAVPATGFMVSLPGHTRIVSEADLRGPGGRALLARYARENAGALQQPGAHLGGWTDKASGKTYLDISHNIKSKGQAVRAGRARNQIAIWDVKNGREIRTGGTGA